jgi:hypothetical protein
MLINCILYQEVLSLGSDFPLSYFSPCKEENKGGGGWGVMQCLFCPPWNKIKEENHAFLLSVVLFAPTPPTCPAS